MKKLCKDFLKCGTIGWCLEILVSGAEALRRQDKTLTCHTSLWMFPIYGCACLIGPLYRILKHLPKTVRGLIYMTGIFSVEYATGRFLDKKGQCPWSYQKSPWNISHVIRLDFAPAWFLIGLLFEKAVAADDSRTLPPTAAVFPQPFLRSYLRK